MVTQPTSTAREIIMIGKRSRYAVRGTINSFSNVIMTTNRVGTQTLCYVGTKYGPSFWVPTRDLAWHICVGFNGTF